MLFEELKCWYQFKKKSSLITDTLINNLYGGHMIEQMMSYTVGLCYTIDCTPSKEPR